ncbi:MAG: glycosyltransferase family A protein [Algoriphagus sp.]|uniref:glycosyltransferase family 2 protein n=1 Tax=Algoriphagus sp. TaxID=1872435 RepID=UPI00263823BE|nr:glycosyltransferase family A protein [Algoriphagus sp.]MDG1277519.1 glycosyltransferase family A protein [Algoriphagus sp.]
MISVIIPFYKAENFILQSSKSASIQKIVSEVIVVYDGCPNTTFNELKILLYEMDKVFLIHHKGFINQGPGASRNLGILKASNNWIAFLDADDYFLENRFDSFKKAIKNDLVFDGMYEAAIYERSTKLYTVLKSLSPSKLLHYLIRGTYGHFCTDGIIVKRELCLKAGMFNEELKLHQDSEFWLRLAFYGNLVAGDIKNPVSIIRKHENNRIWKGTSNSSRLKQWKITWRWAWDKPVGIINKLLILRKLFKYKIGSLRE